ncbi:hypothetical protein vseg_018670 [Gypsophila vaccaria]
MANSSRKIELISECYIKPDKKIEATKSPYYLNPVDLAFLSLDKMQRGLVFGDQPLNMQLFLEKLKESLSISLVYFYPLAGQFATVKFHDENVKWVYLDCNKGPGARVIHAIAKDVSIRDVLAPAPAPAPAPVHDSTTVQSLFDLGVEAVNYEGHHGPLLSIQVTELYDGIFIGFTMNHSVADGTSLWQFISTLSEIFDQLIKDKEIEGYNIKVSRKPIFEPYFPQGCGPIIRLPDHNEDKLITQPNLNHKEILRKSIFHFSSESIRNLKTKANKEYAVHNVISSFQALSAFIWRSITRARSLDRGLDTCCALVMNARPRLNPPISSDYFGNFVTRNQTICKVGELLDNGLGWASMLVHQLVAHENEEKVNEFCHKMIQFMCKAQNEEVGPLFYSPNAVVVGGSTRFDMYGPGFGLGKAQGVLVGKCNEEDGKITVSPGRKGDGSVDLEVYLKPKTMYNLLKDEEFTSLVD